MQTAPICFIVEYKNYGLKLFKSVVRLNGKPCAYCLEYLNQDNQQDNCANHNEIFISVISIVDCDFSQTAAADNTAHRGISQDSGNGDCHIRDE